ncbi:MAG: peptidoglycan D,D-transpeptidase FtsI family protein, partial [Steroidobacteraceae bacterium]
MKKRSESGELDASRFRGRSRLVALAVLTAALLLGGRAVQLQVLDREFLAQEGGKRYLRDARVPAHRGAILDRFGEPLAVSAPVDTVIANPQVLATSPEDIVRLAQALGQDRQWLAQRIAANHDRQYYRVERHMEPGAAAKIRELGIPGVYLEREYKRYYPNGEITGHLLGFTNLDEDGQEGLELAFDGTLSGMDGLKRVIKDARGRTIENVENLRAPRPGEDLLTSLDLRIQYLAYRELKAAVQRHRARAGSMIVLDVDTGEVLAMVNQPAFNPNDRSRLEVARYRNRAVTDIIEPGSSIKPFIVAAALDSGGYRRDSVIDTSPGLLKVGNMTVKDKHDLGRAGLDVILSRSSNVGMAKLALKLEPEEIHRTLAAFGFGQVTASGFPAESPGLLSEAARWRPINVATLSYGYGMSATPLQIVQAYATLGALGMRRPVTFQRVDKPVTGTRVVSAAVARDLVGLLAGVVTVGGTAQQARVPGYRVSGKTGTA